MAKRDDEGLSLREDAELKRILGEDEEVAEEAKSDMDEAQEEVMGILTKLVEGFMDTQKEVVKQSNENRSGLQDEIDTLHKKMVSPDPTSKMRDAELEALAKLRQIQTDQTSNRVQLMDSAARMISALKYMMKSSDGGKKRKGDDGLRDMLGGKDAE